MGAGAKLKKWRTKRGWTIYRLAKEIGRQWGDVDRYEDETTTPSLETAASIETVTEGAIKCVEWVL